MLSSNDIRQRFLTFFNGRGHTVVASGSLVPGNDPTLLFTNAGMVPFKDVFLGREQRDYVRATSSQRCVRAGGKHNDLENVGYTARHHTFFEMLGNFSFGDYFKHEAIAFAWAFLTEDLKLPPEKLWVTVFEGDSEAEAIWLDEVGIDPARFSRIGAKDNFWAMGDTGPCGPCSEIFYDHGEHIFGGPPGSPDEDGDRYVEIWNLVFMQYDRLADGTLKPLPKPSVDTGMGLERVAAVCQGVHNNYDIDLFQGLIAAAAAATGVKSTGQPSLKVIADHIRACAFLITDGIIPAKDGRGYVLRRILRRAIRHGYKLGREQAFFYKLVAPLVAEMGDAFPELAAAQANVERVIRQEEERFAETLVQGMKLLEDAIARLADKMIPGDVVFKLYDTYGFPVDLTADVARERDLTIDLAGFEAAMDEQRSRARAASRFDNDYHHSNTLDASSQFQGYDQDVTSGQVLALLADGQTVAQLQAGQEGAVVLDHTPFYAEAGGQVGDTGILEAGSLRMVVSDTKKQGNAIVHIGRVEAGQVAVGDTLQARIDAGRRAHIRRNHTATHLLHAALRQVLGGHVTQKGSLVAADRLRFDFAHHAAVSADELQQIERLVNQQILANMQAETRETSYDDAIAEGAMALFGEKYGDRVRMLKLGSFSTELCGGTHVERSGDIGLFKITAESGVAAGVRRIEAVTGEAALRHVSDLDARVQQLASVLRSSSAEVVAKVEQLLEHARQLEKSLATANSKLAAQQGGDLADQAQTVGATRVLAARLDGQTPKQLRETMDQLKQKLGSAVIVLGAANDGKVALVAGVTEDQTHQLRAGELIANVAAQVGGRGGGRADMAQAGGSEPGKLDAALASVLPWVQEQLGAQE